MQKVYVNLMSWYSEDGEREAFILGTYHNFDKACNALDEDVRNEIVDSWMADVVNADGTALLPNVDEHRNSLIRGKGFFYLADKRGNVTEITTLTQIVQ